jgi:BirA family biotin operon repressor/biotin-[acetyl-CoA-carboxylase] ligase
MRIITIDSCLSTNSYLKELNEKQTLEEGSIVVAGEQTAGRGQAGNQWESEAGKNLTFSLVLYPCFLPLKDHFLLSEIIALGIKSVLDRYTNGITIKWPNDLYYQDKKIAGILIENDITGSVISRSIAGIGININQQTFLSDAPNPISLMQITGKETNLDDFLGQLSDSILGGYEQLKSGQIDRIVQAYHQSLYRKEGFYSYKDSESSFIAQIESVGNDGLLSLITQQGEKRRYAFKEVAFH